jgi:hypothetical protein
MNKDQKLFLFILLVLGTLVPLSYIIGLGDKADTMWGGVPSNIRPLYTISMLISAIGFFIFSTYTFLNVFKDGFILPYSLKKWTIHLSYLLILIPSALWIPLVNVMLDRPSTLIWVAIRSVLILVALGTLILLILITKAKKEEKGLFYYASVVGLILFLFHTGILDAIIWPILFPY